jgi:hypothetical protein
MATSTKTQKKLQLLRTLIEHPRTSDTEREAAKRALERLLSKAQDTEETVTTSWIDFSRTYGSKYASMGGKYLSAAEIAKLIRADIKLALKVARQTTEPGAVALPDALTLIPAEVKVTVRTESYSGGRSIDVVMRNIPEDWGFSMQPDHYDRTTLRSLPTPELKAAARALKDILQAYNYDGSRPEVDYFDVNDYGHVVSSTGLTLA